MLSQSAPKRRLMPHGGARRQSGRASYQLSEKQCRDLIACSDAAWDQGFPFNRFITVLWERAGTPAKQNAATTARFIKLASDWARRHDYRLRWAFVQESGPKNGAHVHILLHVPTALERQFAHMPLKWVKHCLAGDYVAKTLQSQKIAFSGKVDTNACAYEAALMGKVHYMLKCAPTLLEQALDMIGLGHKPWGQKCRVYAKRLSVWQGAGNA